MLWPPVGLFLSVGTVYGIKYVGVSIHIVWNLLIVCRLYCIRLCLCWHLLIIFAELHYLEGLFPLDCVVATPGMPAGSLHLWWRY